MHFGEIIVLSKLKKIATRKRVPLEFLHHRLGHKSTRSLLAADTNNFWKDIELKIDPDFFYSMSYFFNEQKG